MNRKSRICKDCPKYECIQGMDEYGRSFKDFACSLEVFAYSKSKYDKQPIPDDCMYKLEQIVTHGKKLR